ncbi:hypothetical protein OHA72_07725 [Dactylosporangium sp. NBC_01737]|uniref:hypothetical protein n=1 Tax=Dactylosporangium sp. NBC_01737 TaxID=2975959 RepID=UPI002E111ACD|nr:hypothetical protein OHA72_07725 [Dactylosporangium sp. NBC_01737]
MDTYTLRRLSGLAAVAAGPLCIIGGLLHPIEDGQGHNVDALVGPHAFGSSALLLGTVLLLLGLPGAYGWIAPRLGALGLVGFVLYFVGNVLSAIPHLVIMGFAASDMAHHHPDMISEKDVIIGAPAFEAEQIASGLGLVAGLLVFGIALLRGRAVPRWIGWTGVAGAVLQLVPLPATPMLTGLQIELLRGAMLIGLGLLAIRSVPSQTALAPAAV